MLRFNVTAVPLNVILYLQWHINARGVFVCGSAHAASSMPRGALQYPRGHEIVPTAAVLSPGFQHLTSSAYSESPEADKLPIVSVSVSSLTLSTQHTPVLVAMLHHDVLRSNMLYYGDNMLHYVSERTSPEERARCSPR